MGKWVGEAAKKYYREYYLRNKERYRTKQREWYDKNRESNLAYQREWRAANKEKKAAFDKQWRENNLERIRKTRDTPENRAKNSARARRWATNNLSKVNEHSRIKRARIRSVYVERIVFEDVVERDRWLCGICGKRVKPEDATLDHIKPLSKGGEHSYANVQLAHFTCNCKKGATWPWSRLGNKLEEI